MFLFSPTLAYYLIDHSDWESIWNGPGCFCILIDYTGLEFQVHKIRPFELVVRGLEWAQWVVKDNYQCRDLGVVITISCYINEGRKKKTELKGEVFYTNIRIIIKKISIYFFSPYFFPPQRFYWLSFATKQQT